MQPHLALGLAIATGALAVGVVSLDLAYTLTVSIQEPEQGGWRTVATAPVDSYAKSYPGDCASPHLRVHVDNHKPLSDAVRVRITYNAYGPASIGSGTVLDETWSLAAFQQRDHEFTIPDSAFNATNGQKGQASVNVQIDNELFVSACVEKGAA